MFYHNVIFIILKVWKSYFPHQKQITDQILVFLSLVLLQNSNSTKMIPCWYCTSTNIDITFLYHFCTVIESLIFQRQTNQKESNETKWKKNIYNYITKGLLHWYRWILSLNGISMDACKLASLISQLGTIFTDISTITLYYTYLRMIIVQFSIFIISSYHTVIVCSDVWLTGVRHNHTVLKQSQGALKYTGTE